MSVANGSGRTNTGESRQKGREAKEWTGQSPVVRKFPVQGEHEEIINHFQELWGLGMMGEYVAWLKKEGYDAQTVSSLLSQGSQGMPGRGNRKRRK